MLLPLKEWRIGHMWDSGISDYKDPSGGGAEVLPARMAPTREWKGS